MSDKEIQASSVARVNSFEIKITQDGNQVSALIGGNLQEGRAWFGRTISSVLWQIANDFEVGCVKKSPAPENVLAGCYDWLVEQVGHPYEQVSQEGAELLDAFGVLKNEFPKVLAAARLLIDNDGREGTCDVSKAFLGHHRLKEALAKCEGLNGG